VFEDGTDVRAGRQARRVPPARRCIVGHCHERPGHALRTNAYAFKGLRSEEAHTGTNEHRHDGGAQKHTFPHMPELSGEVRSEVSYEGAVRLAASCNEAESDRRASPM
jgi:hypothetical protein